MDYSKALEQIKDWIKSLVIIQYRESKKNKAFLDAIVEILFANCLPLQIRDLCLNIEKSEDKQLEIVGDWVGIDKYYVLDIITGNYFSLPRYANSRTGIYLQGQGGFSNYTNFNDLAGGFLTYAEWFKTIANVNKMSDYWFRKLIQLKAIKNSIDFTNKNIDEAIKEWSNNEIYITWDGAKQMTYHYPATWFETMSIAVAKNALPAPTGCIINIMEYN